MRMKKELTALAAACLLIVGMGLPARAQMSGSQAIQLNPDNQNDQPFENQGMTGYIRFAAENTDGKMEYSSTQRDSSYDGTTLIIGQQDYVVLDNVKSMSLVGQIVNTNTTKKNMNVTIYLPRINKDGDMSVDASRLPVPDDPKSMVTSSNDQSKVNVYFEYTSGEKNINDIKIIRLNGEYAPGETLDINVPLTTPEDGKDNGATLFLGWPSHGVHIKAIKKSIDVEDLYGANIYPAVAENNTGSGTYKVWDDLKQYMPKMSKELLFASHYKKLYTNQNNNPDLSTLESDDALYSNSQFIIKTEPIFNAVKDHGYSTYSDVHDPKSGDKRGFWDTYVYFMEIGTDLVNQDGELLVGDVNGTKRRFYVEVHKVLDAKDLYLNVNDKWDAYDNLTYHKTVTKALSNSQDIPTSEIRVENNVDVTKAGVYDVKYLYDVAPEKTVTISAKVYVNAPPQITAEDKTIETGTDLDLLSLVTSATDKEDGDLKGTDKVTVQDDGEFNKDVPGEYTVTYEVTDSKGATTTTTAKVTVTEPTPEPEPEPDTNTPPTITAEDKTIEKGTALDLLSLVTSATDKEDGDLTEKVIVKDNGGFDADKVGTYTVTFAVKDSKGEMATVTAKVTVLDKKVVPDTGTKVVPGAGNQPAKHVDKAVKTPKTGDTSQVGMYVMVFMLSFMAVLSVVFIKKRK